MIENRPDSSDPDPKTGIIGRILSSFESLSAMILAIFSDKINLILTSVY